MITNTLPIDKSDFSEHNKEYYIRYYSEVMINNIPELEPFEVRDIPKKLGFDEADSIRFKNSEVLQGIKNFLLSGFATHEYMRYKLNFGAKDKLNGTNKNIKIINGINIEDSTINGSNISNTTNEKSEEKKDLASKNWYQILNNNSVVLILTLILTAILAYFGYIKN